MLPGHDDPSHLLALLRLVLVGGANVLVFLVLAAQYESLTLPLSIILIVPMGLFAAMTGVWISGGDNNVFTQIGLIVLVGLSAKNAILIVEFARELEFAGRTPVQAAIEASCLILSVDETIKNQESQQPQAPQRGLPPGAAQRAMRGRGRGMPRR